MYLELIVKLLVVISYLYGLIGSINYYQMIQIKDWKNI